MAKLRKKVWDLYDITSPIENKENEIDKEIQTAENELVNIHRDLVQLETKFIPMKKKRINQTSVSYE